MEKIKLNKNEMEEKKRITGATIYKGILAQQHENFQEIFRDFFKDVSPKRILEIGTGSGGFTLFIRDCLNELGLDSTELVSYDISPSAVLEELNSKPNTLLSNVNLFSSDNNYILDREDLVVPYIQDYGTTIVMCDGGNKVKEFNQFSKFLKPGDIIMCHDYCDTLENFEEKIFEKIWLWREISDIDIQESINDYKLVPYDKEKFDSIVWGCFIKQ